MGVVGHGFGSTRWAIPEGYIPEGSTGPAPELTSHEALCVLNAGNADAHLNITIFFEDREPMGPFPLEVPARRTRHFRFNNLGGAAIPPGVPYSSLIESDELVVVQYTRLDSRQSENALMSVLAFPCGQTD